MVHFLDRERPSYRDYNLTYTSQVLQDPEHIQHEVKPRLVSKERVVALCSHKNPNLQQIKEYFINWSQYREYLVFRKEHVHTGKRTYKAVLSAKRGNEVYAWRLKQRFEPLMNVPEVRFFNYKDRSKRHKTRAIFVSLTYARFECSRCGANLDRSMEECPGCGGVPRQRRMDLAWEQIGYWYNRWISRLRRRYGGVQAIRVWEAHNDGWPHNHAILIFESKEFEAFHYNGVWRVQGKHELEWDPGFTDVEALSSVRGGIRYVIKYLNKLHKVGIHGGIGDTAYSSEGGLGGLVASASVLTLSLMWAFRRRAFGISRALIDLIASMTNSNSAIQTGLVQVDLAGDPVWIYTLVGFWGGDLGPPWSVELNQAEFFEMKNSPSWSDNLRL